MKKIKNFKKSQTFSLTNILQEKHEVENEEINDYQIDHQNNKEK